MSTASRCFRPVRRACWRKSLEVSTMIVWPACSISTETRKRLSRGSSEVQVSQSQAIEGTPVDVPVPKKVSLISVDSDQWSDEFQWKSVGMIIVCPGCGRSFFFFWRQQEAIVD